MKNIYKVFRLILGTIIITYFFGCSFYMLSSQQFLFSSDETKQNSDTFLKKFDMIDTDDSENSFEYMIKSLYFAITTLSTVGYGDLYPISNFEKIIGTIIMLVGVVFFSFIMGSFIEIISTFN